MLQLNRQNSDAPKPQDTPKFEHPIVLKQSPNWSRAIVWAIVGITGFTIVWASVFKIEEAIPATGKLEPQESVKEVQAPLGGVVRDVHVKEGQVVRQGDRLLSLDPRASQAQLSSLTQIRQALTQENEFYRRQLAGEGMGTSQPGQFSQVRISPELLSLTQLRAALIVENRLYRAQMGGGSGSLNEEQQMRLQARQQERTSRLQAAELQTAQVERQLQQNEIKLTNARELLKVDELILRRLENLVNEGAFSELQYLRQQQEVRNRQSEIQELIQEQERLQFARSQSEAELNQTDAVSQEDVLGRISDNEKRIAEIDSQFTKVMLDNQKRIAEIDSQLGQARVTLQYQEVVAPVGGTIFDLKAGRGFVVNSSEPVLKIVPSDNLVAEVYITNRDIGFVKVGQDVDVRIDSFPFQEYGDIKGNLISIGSDALPPDQNYQYYRFPAKVKLKQQSLKVNQQELPLQSGMAVNVNIKRRDRTIMSIFTDLFVRKVESVKTVR